MLDGSLRNVGLFDETSNGGLVFDITLIGTIMLVIVGVQILATPALQARLEFDYQHIDAISALTSAFIHYNNVHLLSNTIVYLIAVSVVCVLCRQAGQRWWFRSTVLTLVVVLPAMVNITSYVVLTTFSPDIIAAGRGFSGVVAGFIGFLFIALLVWVNDRSQHPIAGSLGPAIFIGLLLEIAIIYSQNLPFDIIGLSLLGIALSGWQIADEINTPELSINWWEAGVEILFAGLVVVLLGIFIFVLFPATIVEQGTMTNIISHGAGFIYGMSVSGITYRLYCV